MTTTRLRIAVIAIAIANLTVYSRNAIAEEAKWGDLEMRFVRVGKPPAQPVIARPAGLPPVVDESLVVDPKTGGIANVFVLCRDKTIGQKAHPSFEDSAKDEIVVHFRGARFAPHAFGIRISQTLLVVNHDPFGQALLLQPFGSPASSLLLPANGQQGTYQFSTPELLPTKVGCPIHPWESGWILAQEHPYFGISGSNGHLKITNLPVGEWEFQFWHERKGNLSNLVQGDKQLTSAKGRRKQTIKEGKNDLGKIEL
jgi:hypothetical protein